ncbi:unnamed protein product, partial [Mesorhabditis belari]|uniref:SRR1-like domain-containing protein n=1 Tax=Mesorhabditis belari TaxID=2138241 RepID=A0AAF3FFE0_9BILA
MSHDKIMSAGGFQIVTGKRAMKKGRTAGPLRTDGTIEEINMAISKATAFIIHTGLHTWLLAKLEQGFHEIGLRSLRLALDKILLLGNGHFDAPWEAGAHQLALINLVAEHYNVVVEIQDPCFTNAEVEWINSNQRFVLVENAQFNTVSMPLFVVSIHSPHFIINDFLKSNWNQKQVLFLGNDYSSTALDVKDPDHETLLCFGKSCEYFPMPVYEPNSSFFFDTSLFYWRSTEINQLPPLNQRDSTKK